VEFGRLSMMFRSCCLVSWYLQSFLEFIQWCIIVLSFVIFWYVSSSTGSCSSKLCKLLICLWKYWFLIVIWHRFSKY
jgi:hypothetical protein